MIKSVVWPSKLTPNVGQRQDNVTGGPASVDKDNTREIVGGKSRWKIYKKENFRKSLQYLGRCKSNSDSATLSKSTNIGQVSFPKTDKNWIRIQVTCDNSEQCRSSVNESGVSEVVVNYDPEDNDVIYNEKAVDVPDEFLRNSCKKNRSPDGWSKQVYRVKQGLHESIQEFLREDWINSEYDDSQCTQNNSKLTDCDSWSSRNDSIKDSNVQFRQRKNSHTMGVNCSTKLDKLRNHSIAPADAGIIICEQKLPDKQEQTVDRTDRCVIDKPPTKLRPTFQASSKEIQTYPDLFTGDNETSPCMSSTIEWNNILHRRNGVEVEKSSNMSKGNLGVSSMSNKLRVPKPAMSTSSLTLSQETEIGLKRYSGGRLLRNFSGSVQNIVSYFKSASEGNLSNLSEQHIRTSRNNLNNTKIDYCPSVLFSRRQIAESKAAAKTKERGLNLKNFKKLFTGNFPNMKRQRDRRGT